MSSDAVAAVVHTFAGYSRYWKPMQVSWSSVAERERLPLYWATDQDPESLLRGQQLLYTPEPTWGARLYSALLQLPLSTQYVLYLQEDQWLQQEPEADWLNRGLARMQREKLWYLGLAPVVSWPAAPYVGAEDLNDPTWYTVSHHAGLWYKPELMRSLRAEDSAFTHEVRINREVHRHHRYERYRTWPGCLPVLDASRQGRLTSAGHGWLRDRRLTLERPRHQVWKLERK